MLEVLVMLLNIRENFDDQLIEREREGSVSTSMFIS